ncbi:MAG: hypothetical protein IJ509_01500 [Bacilli bacterium]|nr:hypothetical protein [Bacilli bacterium]
MKKRLLVLIMMLLSLSGCKVEYQIDLDKYLNINENINVIAVTDSVKNQINEFNLYIPIDKNVNEYESYKTKTEKLEYYNSKKDDNILNFSYKFSNDNYQEYMNSNLVNLAYEYVSISKTSDNILVLSTGKEFMLFDKYQELKEVKITINTNYKVLVDNADTKEKHSYTWVVTPENAYGKSIYLKVDTAIEDLNIFERIITGSSFDIFSVSLIVFLIIYIVYKFLKRRSIKRDEI